MVSLRVNVLVVKRMIEAVADKHHVIPRRGQAALVGESMDGRDLPLRVCRVEFVHRQQFPDEFATDEMIVPNDVIQVGVGPGQQTLRRRLQNAKGRHRRGIVIQVKRDEPNRMRRRRSQELRYGRAHVPELDVLAEDELIQPGEYCVLRRQRQCQQDDVAELVHPEIGDHSTLSGQIRAVATLPGLSRDDVVGQQTLQIGRTILSRNDYAAAASTVD